MIIMMRSFIFSALLTVPCVAVAYAYDLDYGLDDWFLVEAIDSKSRTSEMQVWDITVRRGLVDGKEAFVDFNLVMLRLTRGQFGAYSIHDVETYENTLSSGNVSFAAKALSAEFGITRKLFVKLQFNDDGSLRDLSGSGVDRMDPGINTTYRLVRDPRQIQLLLSNKFPSKEYSFHLRKRQVKR